MDQKTLIREQRKSKRLRTLGTSNPFCRICGKHSWWSQYDYHHVDGHNLIDDDLLQLCRDCHNEVGEMIKDVEPVPPDMDPERAMLIYRLEGQNAVAQLQIAANSRTIGWLRRPLPLPPLPENTDRDEVEL
jgi:hypothetical protein